MHYMSPRYEEWFGYTAEERMNLPALWEQLLHPDDREQAVAQSRAAEASGEPYAADYRMVGRDGTVRWIRDEAALATADDGTPMFWLGVMLDITQRKRHERELAGALELEQQAVQRLRQADDMKNTFLTAVSHDLRTPLAAILGSAITLEQEEELGLSPEDRRALIRTVAVRARKLSRLLTDLLDMERLTRGVVEPNLKKTDLGPVVTRLVEESDLACDGRSLHVECRSVEAIVDVSLVERIVENLLTNAAKYAPSGADVWVRLQLADGGALLAIEDDGPGVPVELRESLFRPFERGPSANPQSPGVGVGLSLVTRFAELHGGMAWVEDRDGGGASFRVWFPAGS
jgi:PAS domain S-box-containing protein